MEEHINKLREWLRYHGDYGVEIDLWGLYGCYTLKITHFNQTLEIYRGQHLEKHLDKALTFLMEIGQEGQQGG